MKPYYKEKEILNTYENCGFIDITSCKEKVDGPHVRRVIAKYGYNPRKKERTERRSVPQERLDIEKDIEKGLSIKELMAKYYRSENGVRQVIKYIKEWKKEREERAFWIKTYGLTEEQVIKWKETERTRRSWWY